MILSIFRPLPVYVRIYPNRVEITNLTTGETRAANAVKPFSNARLIIAEFNQVEQLIRSLLRDMNIKAYQSIKILIQQLPAFEDGLTPIEYRALWDSGMQAGGKTVTVADQDRVLTNDEALAMFNTQRG